jgi:hypothetical protein
MSGSMADDHDIDDGTEIVHHLLVVVAGPHYVDRVEIDADDSEDLDPVFVEVNGLTYERYGDEIDYVEVRFDYVVKRERRLIKKKNPLLAEDEEEGSQRDPHAGWPEGQRERER